MEYWEAKEKIQNLPRFSQSGPSLKRICGLLALLHHPEEKLAVVHIAGTNGKGSVAAMVAQALLQAGYRTGLYISPAVLDFRERIQLDGKMISKEEMARWTEKLLPLAAQIGDVNESEFLTAMAYGYLAEQGCQAVAAEAGLGGRWDATNAIARPVVSIITEIGLDHTAVLGSTITAIAGEKCGIIKAGRPVVTCPGQSEEAMEVIRQAAARQGSRLLRISSHQISVGKMSWEGTDFQVEEDRFHVGMAGGYQVENAVTALAACRLLRKEGWDRLTEDAIRQGLAKARQPARLEILSRQPLVLLDGAHNPQGGKALAQALEALAGNRSMMAVIGVMADKDSDRLLEFLAPHICQALCVAPDQPRALPAAQLRKRAQQEGIPAEALQTIEEAWRRSCCWAQQTGGGVIWCGSLYLASDVHQYLERT